MFFNFIINFFLFLTTIFLLPKGDRWWIARASNTGTIQQELHWSSCKLFFHYQSLFFWFFNFYLLKIYCMWYEFLCKFIFFVVVFNSDVCFQFFFPNIFLCYLEFLMPTLFYVDLVRWYELAVDVMYFRIHVCC